MARIEPVGSVFHLGIRVSQVAQQHTVKIGLSNGDLYMSSLGRYVFGSEISYNKAPPPACLG